MNKFNNNITLRQLSVDDGEDVYQMLQRIGKEENEFTNEVNGMSFREYKDWLVKQNNWSLGLELDPGYVVQTTYWLFAGTTPVGYGKIRNELTEHSRIRGGNIGYAIDPLYRGKGYGTSLMTALIRTAKEKNISERLATVQKYNYTSKRVIEKCGGKLIKETNERWYYEL